MAGDLSHYRAWLLRKPCRCAPCVAKVEVHHPRHCPTHAPGAKPDKSLGGKPGKGQKSSDWYGIPLCPHHHTGELHALKGFFQGWTGDQLRSWQDEQIEALHAEYEAENELRGIEVEDRPGENTYVERVRKSIKPLPTAASERRAILDALERYMGARQHSPDAVEALDGFRVIVEARNGSGGVF